MYTLSFKKSLLSKKHINKIPLISDGKEMKSPLKFDLDIKHPDDLYLIFKEHWNLNKIKFRQDYMVLYFRDNKVMGIALEAIGNTEKLEINTKDQIQKIKKLKVSGIATAYNHSQGIELKPSKTGLKFFLHCYEIFSSLGLDYYDHLILSSNQKDYYSFKNVGLL